MSPTEQPLPASDWQPPSEHLYQDGDLWRADMTSPISYPEAGNDICYQVEDGSYWFEHRMNCILEVVRQFPTTGTLYDIGGGNGYVACAMQSHGMDVVLIEPGSGAINARARGVRNIIHSTLEDARFQRHSLDAAGAFDVLEHIEEDIAFLSRIRDHLKPGGRFFCTVPSLPILWSNEDARAGHFRRYTRKSLARHLTEAGFIVEFTSYFFSWLTLPIWLARSLPSHLGLSDKSKLGSETAVKSDHHLPRALMKPISANHAWELSKLRRLHPIPFGTSLLCVAKTHPFS